MCVRTDVVVRRRRVRSDAFGKLEVDGGYVPSGEATGQIGERAVSLAVADVHCPKEPIRSKRLFSTLSLSAFVLAPRRE